MADVNTETFSLVRAGQPTLAYSLFSPRAAAGAVLVTPGFSEHIGRYRHVAEAWARAGFLVCVYDTRGHGHSAGRRAHVDRFSDYVDDALSLLDELAKRPEWNTLGKPILFGHSMGALVTIFVALRVPSRVRAVALSSPFFGQALATPAWKKALGRFASGIWPTYSDATGITGEMVTHDAERARTMDGDPLRLGRVTARWFTEIEAAHERLEPESAALELPVYCLAAGDDVIADVDATRRVFERWRSSDKELNVVAGRRHELHQETDRDTHIAAFAERFSRWTQ